MCTEISSNLKILEFVWRADIEGYFFLYIIGPFIYFEKCMTFKNLSNGVKMIITLIWSEPFYYMKFLYPIWKDLLSDVLMLVDISESGPNKKRK